VADEELNRLQEQFRQLDLIDSDEKAGNLTQETAAIYRLHVLRGGSIFGLPLDGPNAAEAVKQWQRTDRALTRDGRLYFLQHSRQTAVAAARLPRHRRASGRAPRRNVRRARAQARAPGSKDPPPDLPLEAVPLSRFRRDVRRWKGAA
jgi:hypothetical protein